MEIPRYKLEDDDGSTESYSPDVSTEWIVQLEAVAEAAYRFAQYRKTELDDDNYEAIEALFGALDELYESKDN